VNQNPFGASAAASSPFGVVDRAKEETTDNLAGILGDTARLSGKVNEAKRTGNKAFLVWAKQQASQLASVLGEFIKRAIQLAIFKFALELCSMAIKSLMEALNKRGYGAMDVSTKGVAYHGDGVAQQRSGNYTGNPFDSPAFNKPW
jgi:hypothetical protein